MGERTLRRLLIIAASGVVHWGVPEGSWLARMLAREWPMFVIISLANKNARILWALITKAERITSRRHASNRSSVSKEPRLPGQPRPNPKQVQGISSGRKTPGF